MTNIWKYSCSGIWGTALKPDLDDYEPVFVQEAAKKKKVWITFYVGSMAIQFFSWIRFYNTAIILQSNLVKVN